MLIGTDIPGNRGHDIFTHIYQTRERFGTISGINSPLQFRYLVLPLQFCVEATLQAAQALQLGDMGFRAQMLLQVTYTKIMV